MTLKLIGAVLVVAGCGGCGFAMAASYRREEAALGQYLKALELMEWELSCRLTPLPVLCRCTAESVKGPVSELLLALAQELERQVYPDVNECLCFAMASLPGLPAVLRTHARDLGDTLGRFDLPGQLKGLQSAAGRAKKSLTELEENRTGRLRSYQTLGLCAGAALAILFL